MDLLDLVIFLFAVAFFAAGWHRGVVWEALGIIGLGIGAVVGALLAPPMTRWIAPQSGHGSQPFVATAVFIGCLLLIQGMGSVGGRLLHTRMSLPPLWHRADQAGGGVIGVVGVLMVIWFLGFSFSGSTLSVVSEQFQGSGIERALAEVAPTPPGFLATVQQFLRDSSLPEAFAGIAPVLQAQPLPMSVVTPGIEADGAEVYRVTASGCEGEGGYEVGSGWPIGSDLVLTNAHVVAGSTEQTITPPHGVALSAQVVFFDPNEDIALLLVPGLAATPLPMAFTPVPVGTQGAVLGYPEGGLESATPMAVENTVPASGLNIYSNAYVTRQVMVLTSDVIPGDSGGPVVNLEGQVVGVTFARSTTDTEEGYALSLSGLASIIQGSGSLTATVSTESCLSG
jgi:S1-C subfamily serine protease